MSRPALAHLLVLALVLAGPPARAQEEAPAEGEPQAELPPITVPPQLVDFVEAPYPEEAAAAEVEGTVTLLISLDASGTVTAAEILDEPRLPPPAGGEPRTWGFGQAAAAAALQWAFTPAEDPTGPVPVAFEFAYDFQVPEPPPPPDPAAAPAQVRGQLLEMGTRRPLAGFPVRVTDSAGAAWEVETDDEGWFSLGAMAPGPGVVVATYPGFSRAEEPAILPVEGAEALELKLWIKNLSFREDELVGYYRLPSEDVTRRTISTEEIKRIPGTFGDPVRVVQNLPGAARSPLGTGLLVIRGANPEDSGVYVDGIRIPFIYHLGGYVSVLNADLVDSIDYLPGGYGVEYGRSMGGVLDVKTKREWPERRKLTWSTDILDSGGLFAGKLGQDEAVGLGVAARRSYVDLFIPIFTGGTGFTVRPRWLDYQVKVEALKLPRGHFSALLFGFEDTLFVSTPDDLAQGTDQDTQGDIGTRYGTHRLMARWEHPLGEELTLRLVPSFGLDLAEFNLGEEFDLYQDQWLWEVRGELDWTPSEALSATVGVDFIGGWYTFETRFPFDPTSFANYDPLAEREGFVQEGRGSAWGPDLYLDLKWRPLPDRERLLVVPGVRTNFVNIVDQYAIFGVDPRISTRLKVLPGGTLKAGAGLYHQPPQPFEGWRPDGDVQLWYEEATAAEIGWEQELLPGLDADVSFFYKWMDGLIVSNPDLQSFEDQFFVNEGIGRAYGVETILRQAPVGPFFGWISYTLSRSMRNDYPERNEAEPTGLFGPYEGDQGWYPFEFDQTHILVAVGGYKLPRNWELSGKIQYVTGNPYTPYSGGVYDVDQDLYYGYSTGSYNSERLPPFWAVDLRVDKLFTFKRWQLELYVDLLNVLRGTNPEFVQNNYDYTEEAYIRGLPFIPSPGFEARFEF